MGILTSICSVKSFLVTFLRSSSKNVDERRLLMAIETLRRYSPQTRLAPPRLGE
jgi:hypothetical protein